MTPLLQAGRSRLARATRLALLGALAAVAMLGMSGTAAHATTIGTAVKIAPSSNPFLTVEVRGASTAAGAEIDQYLLNAGNHQEWKLEAKGNYVWIKNVNSGLCLASDGVAGHTAFQWYCNDTDYHLQWATGLVAGNGVAYTIQNRASGLYLDVRGASGASGADIITWYGNGARNQLFYATGA
ncbi:RICIN domain-containing protein [Virgisporangium aurantiacum]|uniref:Ricin B lectin domain-containing protein n=1 Tax=Virgisporangium aurantiacum TaxID=175570 RepID=A0A8J3YZY6_9ACTN|nr:RICIN domain-containing protein [Virgisporangium aurantiacum]GIJ54764.1 hypothetical protein Vau01_022800 [Virgisporangium aurantiacum]